jgi:membrane fusion protein, multidrug efflux system
MQRRRLILLLIAGIGLAYFAVERGLLSSRPPGAPKDAVPAIPVLATSVKRDDVPVSLAGFGTVQAFNSVLVKSRVDGQIVKINFSEGKDVKAGEVLVEIDPAPLEAALAQARATKLKDEAQLNNARLDFERASRLAATGSGSRQQLDTSQALVAQLEAAIKADQAMIDMAENQLNYTRIRSPIDGRVGTRIVDIGNIVRATDNAGIVIVNQLHPIFVNFALPADSLPQIRAKSKNSDIKVSVQDSNGAELAVGTLAVIDNQINPATGTINYKATFDNGEESLWPGQFVNVRVEVDVRRNVIVVPVTVVQQGPEGPYCFVVGQDRVVQKRPLKVGFVNKTTAVIDEGLSPDELVVVDGQYRIQGGSSVEVRTGSIEPSR